MADEMLVVLARRRGRPPRSAVPATRRIEIKVTDDEAADLNRVAAENRLPVAGLIRDAVNEFVADYRERKIFSR